MQLPGEGKFEQYAKLLRLRHYLEGWYAVIGCYLDESIDPKQQGIFAVGGILGRGRPIFELDRKWEQLRKQPEIDIEYFKASECQSGKKQFSKFVVDPNNITPQERSVLDGIWDKFLDLMIGDSHEGLIIYGIGVVQDDFYKVTQDPKAKAILGDTPYWFAYQAAMIEAAYAMKQLHGGLGDTVAIICDMDEEHSGIAPEVYREIKNKNPNSAQYMGPFGMEHDHACEPLQAADAAVYEVRRSLQVSLGRWNHIPQWKEKSLRWQFNKLDKQKRVWLIQYADKRYLEEVVKENIPGQPLNMDHFMEQEFKRNVHF